MHAYRADSQRRSLVTKSTPHRKPCHTRYAIIFNTYNAKKKKKSHHEARCSHTLQKELTHGARCMVQGARCKAGRTKTVEGRVDEREGLAVLRALSSRQGVKYP